jgi:hypothetical protein
MASLAYLLTRNAAYRLAPGKPPQKIALDLGIGPVLADSGIVFWSKGAIWNASKDGASVWRVAALSSNRSTSSHRVPALLGSIALR